jgi:hypothetical protein
MEAQSTKDPRTEYGTFEKMRNRPDKTLEFWGGVEGLGGQQHQPLSRQPKFESPRWVRDVGVNQLFSLQDARMRQQRHSR